VTRALWKPLSVLAVKRTGGTICCQFPALNNPGHPLTFWPVFENYQTAKQQITAAYSECTGPFPEMNGQYKEQLVAATGVNVVAYGNS
jgi:hypothetical protein